MSYSTIEEIEKRYRALDADEKQKCESLLEDAASMIDSVVKDGISEETKALVSRNMVIRALGSMDVSIPVGATQASQGGLGYTQSFTFGSGQSGELYFSRMDKKLLKIGNRIGSKSPVETMTEERTDD